MKPDNRKPQKAASKEIVAVPAPSGELQAFTPAAILEQVALIQQIMVATMKDGEHYGKIPGCGDRPSLLKPGAEKLCLTFRLAPSYDLAEKDHPNGHREYRVTCSLASIVTGAFVGQGVGVCSTLEGKYRYRRGEGEATDRPVPRAYWDIRAEDPAKAQELLGGRGFSPKKVEGKGWMIAKGGGQVEHDNPADHLNTVLKMAKKRALVDAVLTATAASDLFSQDLEDIAANMALYPSPLPEPAKPAENRTEPARPAPQTVSEGEDSGNGKTRPQAAPETQTQLDMTSDPAPAAAETRPAGWRGVRVHFGKNRGTALADLKPAAVKWYFDDWMPKNEAAGQQGKEDLSLCRALKEWNRCGVLLNAIGIKCDKHGWKESVIADHVRQQAELPMQTLAEFPEETLRMILDGFDAIALEIAAPGC